MRDILKLTFLFELELYSVLGKVTFKSNALQYLVTFYGGGINKT